MIRIYEKRECANCSEVREIAAKGLCRRCYSRLQRNGTFENVRIRNSCKIDGCDGHVISEGLCDKHRKQVARHGEIKSLRPDDWGKREKHDLYVYWSDTKRRETLNICDKWKNDFWAFVECVSPRPSKNHFLRAEELSEILGPENWKWVEGITKANRLVQSRQKKANAERNRLRISAEERQELLLSAKHKCEICGAEFSSGDCPTTGEDKTKALCIDHCHETGKIRGVLCRACNSGIGHLKDSTELLRNAIRYLKKE